MVTWSSTPLHQAAYGSPAVRSHIVWEWGYEIESKRKKAQRDESEEGGELKKKRLRDLLG